MEEASRYKMFTPGGSLSSLSNLATPSPFYSQDDMAHFEQYLLSPAGREHAARLAASRKLDFGQAASYDRGNYMDEESRDPSSSLPSYSMKGDVKPTLPIQAKQEFAVMKPVRVDQGIEESSASTVAVLPSHSPASIDSPLDSIPAKTTRKRAGNCYGYNVAYRGVDQIVWLNEKLSSLDLDQILGDTTDRDKIKEAIGDGSILVRALLCNSFIRKLTKPLRLHCNKALDPSTPELRGFIVHILIDYPELAKELINDCKSRAYRRMCNMRLDDNKSRQFADRVVKKRKVVESDQEVLTEDQSIECMKEMYSMTIGTTGYDKLARDSRQFRVRFCQSAGPTQAITRFPILARDSDLMSNDFRAEKKIDTDFANQWSTMTRNVIIQYKDFFKDNFVEDLQIMYEFDDVVAVFVLLKMLDSRRSHLRGERIFQFFPNAATPEEALQMRSTDKFPAIFMFGVNPSFHIAVESHEIHVGKSFPRALFLLLSVHYQFNLSFSPDVRDFWSFVEMILQLKPSHHSQRAREIHHKLTH